MLKFFGLDPENLVLCHFYRSLKASKPSCQVPLAVFHCDGLLFRQMAVLMNRGTNLQQQQQQTVQTEKNSWQQCWCLLTGCRSYGRYGSSSRPSSPRWYPTSLTLWPTDDLRSCGPVGGHAAIVAKRSSRAPLMQKTAVRRLWNWNQSALWPPGALLWPLMSFGFVLPTSKIKAGGSWKWNWLVSPNEMRTGEQNQQVRETLWPYISTELSWFATSWVSKHNQEASKTYLASILFYGLFVFCCYKSAEHSLKTPKFSDMDGYFCFAGIGNGNQIKKNEAKYSENTVCTDFTNVKLPYSKHHFVDMYTKHFIMCLLCNAIIFAGVLVIILNGRMKKKSK